MPTNIWFYYEGIEGQFKVQSTIKAIEIRNEEKSLKDVTKQAAEALNIHPATYDLEDEYGMIENLEDLKRAIKMAGDPGDCVLKVEEHHAIKRSNELKKEAIALEKRVQSLETKLAASGKETDDKIEKAIKVVTNMIDKTDGKVGFVTKRVDALEKDMQIVKDNEEKIMEKLGAINIAELHDMAENIKEIGEQVKNCIKKVLDLDHRFDVMKVQLTNDVKRAQEEVKDLQRYMQGKLDILLEADGDMRRDLQLLSERLSLSQDDHKLMQDGLSKLANKCAGALEESEELRDLLGQMKEETMFVRSESAQTAQRMHCLEGEASEKWIGFQPGVMYFRRWHQFAKGGDVQLSGDLCIATGRGRLASTGVVCGNDEGLCVSDGPARRFGTPGYWSSYFEIEVDEISSAAKGTGGLYVGFALQSAGEICDHPRHEFDGWLMGGSSKALICRASVFAKPDAKPTDIDLPDTFGVGVAPGDESTVADSVKMLRLAMPPKTRGETRDVSSTWPAQDLRLKDRVGVLFRCNRDGGAVMKIAINGIISAEHNFRDAPPAEAVGFLTPVMRLAGTGKSAKIFPGLQPPSKILADLRAEE